MQTNAHFLQPQGNVSVAGGLARLNYIVVCNNVVQTSFTAAQRVAGVNNARIIAALRSVGITASSVTVPNVEGNR